MAKITIQKKKTAELELLLNDEDIKIEYRVDSVAGYQKATEVMKRYHDIASKQDVLTNGSLSEKESIDILDESINLMVAFRDAVHIAIRDEQYNKHLKSVEDDIPFPSWVAILSEIITKYTEYFRGLASTDGEL